MPSLDERLARIETTLERLTEDMAEHMGRVRKLEENYWKFFGGLAAVMLIAQVAINKWL